MGRRPSRCTVPPNSSGLKFRVLQTIARITRRYHPRDNERLLRLIYSPDRRQTDHFDIVAEYGPDLLIGVNSASYLEWKVFFFGYHEPDIVRLFRRLVKPGFVIMDVGANVGSHTLTLASLTGPTGRVIAVEPHPDVFTRLVRNININRLTNVQAIQCALSDVTGLTALYSFEAGDPNQGKSSLSADSADGITRRIEVECVALDELMSVVGGRLDLVKMDVEGNEYNVLLGSRKSLHRFQPYVLFEYIQDLWARVGRDFGMVQTLLSELGYVMYVVRSGFLEEVGYCPPESANILAIPRGYFHSEKSLHSVGLAGRGGNKDVDQPRSAPAGTV